jgi:hypothetical protein
MFEELPGGIKTYPDNTPLHFKKHTKKDWDKIKKFIKKNKKQKYANKIQNT